MNEREAKYGSGEHVVYQSAFDYGNVPAIGSRYAGGRVVWRSNTYHGGFAFGSPLWEIGVRFSWWTLLLQSLGLR